MFLAPLSESSSSSSSPTAKSGHKPPTIANRESHNTPSPATESRHKPLTIADREGQDLFHNKSQYGVVVTSFCQDHNLHRANLQKLVLPGLFQSEFEDGRLQIFGTACLDYLQRVHAQLSSLSTIQLNMLNSFQPNHTRHHPFQPILPSSLIKYSRVISTFLYYLFRLFKQKKITTAIVGDILASSQEFRNIIREMKAISLPDRNIELWKDQDKEMEADQEDISLSESEILAEEEDEEGLDEEGEEDSDEEEEENSSDDDDEEYVFEEDQNPVGHLPPLHPNSTHNHSILIEMEKKCFSPTPKMQAIQKLILKLMHFLLTYHSTFMPPPPPFILFWLSAVFT